MTLPVPGRHYVLDALAALAAGLALGFPFAELKRGLEAFSGTRRRMELKGEAAGVRVYDSYAHHPGEIAGDLQAARAVAGEGAGRGRLPAAPRLAHQDLRRRDGRALGAADEVVVMDVYLAREDPEPGVDGGLVAARVPLPADRVVFVPSWSAVARRLVDRAGPGDLVLTLGAGDVTQIGPAVLELLAGREPAGGDT